MLCPSVWEVLLWKKKYKFWSNYNTRDTCWPESPDGKGCILLTSSLAMGWVFMGAGADLSNYTSKLLVNYTICNLQMGSTGSHETWMTVNCARQLHTPLIDAYCLVCLYYFTPSVWELNLRTGSTRKCILDDGQYNKCFLAVVAHSNLAVIGQNKGLYKLSLCRLLQLIDEVQGLIIVIQLGRWPATQPSWTLACHWSTRISHNQLYKPYVSPNRILDIVGSFLISQTSYIGSGIDRDIDRKEPVMHKGGWYQSAWKDPRGLQN